MQAFTVEQAAATLAVDTESVRRWLREGRMGGFKAGAAWRVTQADLDAFIERNRNSYRPERGRPPENEDAEDRAALARADTGDFEDWQTVKARNGL